jgi:hypothetical protein
LDTHNDLVVASLGCSFGVSDSLGKEAIKELVKLKEECNRKHVYAISFYTSVLLVEGESNMSIEIPNESKKCRKAGFFDYLAVIVVGAIEKYAEDELKEEEKKPHDQRNNVAIVLGELFRRPFFSYVKYEINKDLCNPIA